MPVVIFAFFVALGYLVLRFTTYGRSIYAVGGNPEAARLSGLNTTGLIMSVYVISGFLAGLCGFLLTSRLGAAEVVAGQGYELIVIAAVVIGGTSLYGGKGHVIGTVFGVLFLALVDNSLNLIGLNFYTIAMVKGGVILLAALTDALRNRFITGA